jgi:hypothetical protein
MISIKLPPKAYALFQKMAKESGTSEADLALELIMDRIEDYHDAEIIADRAKEPGEHIPLADVVRDLEKLELAQNHAGE